jgi:hypothetical protein
VEGEDGGNPPSNAHLNNLELVAGREPCIAQRNQIELVNPEAGLTRSGTVQRCQLLQGSNAAMFGMQSWAKQE